MEEGGSSSVDTEGTLKGSAVVFDSERTTLTRHRPGLSHRVKDHNNVMAVSCTGRELRKPVHINKKTHTDVSTIYHELKIGLTPISQLLLNC